MRTEDIRNQILDLSWAMSSLASYARLGLMCKLSRLATKLFRHLPFRGMFAEDRLLSGPEELMDSFLRWFFSGECFYCKEGFTARCERSLLFGSPGLDGGQAEYVRVPYADSTIVKAPETISDRALLLMADIFPTGFFGVKSALDLSRTIDVTQSTIVVVGCGPVGLCAIACASDLNPQHLFAVDAVDSRLDVARKLGAKTLNFKQDAEGMRNQILQATDGRGADMIVEVVGLSPALRTAFELVRPFGVISSIGVHNAEVPHELLPAYLHPVFD